MNRFCVVFVASLVTVTFAEPPALSQYYGVPEISSGYSYQPSSQPHSVETDYIEQHVGLQTSEGIHLDSNLLHKIQDILIQHENSRNKIASAPSSAYGIPQSSYGPPSHWSPSLKVVGIDFDQLKQSTQVAEYLARERYASSYNSGWSSGNAGSSSYVISSKPSAWVQQAPQNNAPSSPGWSLSPPQPSGWTVVKPAVKYGIPHL